MSGRKITYVRVEEGEWQRTQQAAARLRDVQADLPALLDGVRAAARQDAQRSIDAVTARQRDAEQAISRLSADNRRIERETGRRLAEQSARMMAAIDENAASIRADTQAALAAQEQALRSAIATERRTREREIAQLRSGLNEVLADRQRALDVARQWLADADTIRELIEALPHEFLAPGRLAPLERELATARETAASGLGEAALAGAQRAYHGLSDLRIELEEADRVWRLVHGAAREALLVVLAQIESRAVCAGIDEHGEELADVQLDVDFWSQGELTALRADLEGELRRVDDAGTPLSTAELRALVERRAPELSDRLGEIVERAGLAQLGSQLRVNIADVVVQTLVENGFELAEHTWAGEDERGSFFAKVAHPDGGEVVVDVTPSASDPSSSELRVLSYDEDAGADELRRARARDLAASLRESGLDSGVPQETEEGPAPQFRDFGAVRAGTVLPTPATPAPARTAATGGTR
ncbi:hypothetical protein [Frankia sp. QA3]|uniref:hypothetical protein n=1 Tax=Frankia sp. QA3 TaxID=710111 RepID=UPI000269C4A2|nr:hypothetical protein [Frankia sp. QA3]EIV94355.1 hypothetical protein FraQA3DRAFT_4106 [Frankia sp. QA3]